MKRLLKTEPLSNVKVIRSQRKMDGRESLMKRQRPTSDMYLQIGTNIKGSQTTRTTSASLQAPFPIYGEETFFIKNVLYGVKEIVQQVGLLTYVKMPHGR